jgi:hypothetical protein
MSTRTLSQNSRFHTLLTLRKMDKSDKIELVKTCSDGRTTSSADLTMDEMAAAIRILEDDQTTSVKKMRAKIINVARDIFGLVPKDDWGQAEYDKLNTFLRKKFKGAELSKLTYEQLPKAVTAMEAWRKTETKNMVNQLLNGA